MSKTTESGIRLIALAMARVSAGLVVVAAEVSLAVAVELHHRRAHFHQMEVDVTPTARSNTMQASRILTDATILRRAANVNSVILDIAMTTRMAMAHATAQAQRDVLTAAPATSKVIARLPGIIALSAARFVLAAQVLMVSSIKLVK